MVAAAFRAAHPWPIGTPSLLTAEDGNGLHGPLPPALGTSMAGGLLPGRCCRLVWAGLPTCASDHCWARPTRTEGGIDVPGPLTVFCEALTPILLSAAIIENRPALMPWECSPLPRLAKTSLS